MGHQICFLEVQFWRPSGLAARAAAGGDMGQAAQLSALLGAFPPAHSKGKQASGRTESVPPSVKKQLEVYLRSPILYSQGCSAPLHAREAHPNRRQGQRSSHKISPTKGTMIPLAGGGIRGAPKAAAQGADPIKLML